MKVKDPNLSLNLSLVNVLTWRNRNTNVTMNSSKSLFLFTSPPPYNNYLLFHFIRTYCVVVYEYYIQIKKANNSILLASTFHIRTFYHFTS